MSPAKNLSVSPFIALGSPIIFISLFVFQLINSAISSNPGPPDHLESSSLFSDKTLVSIRSKVL